MSILAAAVDTATAIHLFSVVAANVVIVTTRIREATILILKGKSFAVVHNFSIATSISSKISLIDE